MTVEAQSAADEPPEFVVPQNAPANAATNEEENGGTRQAGTDDEPKDVRSLLANAMKRDASGKFAGLAEPGDADAAPVEPVPVVAAPAPPVQHNSSLSVDEQAALSALPEANRQAVQSLLEARGTAYAQHAHALSEQVRGYGGIEQIVGPRRQAWAMQGVAPEQALNQLLALSDFAGRDPGQFVQWFSNQHGLDLYQLAEGYVPPAPQDPQILAMQSELAQLKGFIGTQQTQQHQQRHSAIMNEIGHYAQEAGQDGKPLRPHFDAVIEDMLHLMPGIMQQNGGMSRRDALQVAYDRAVWSNPQTRALMQNEAAAQARASASAAAAGARKASRSITGTAPVGEVPTVAAAASKTVRGALEAALAQHS